MAETWCDGRTRDCHTLTHILQTVRAPDPWRNRGAISWGDDANTAALPSAGPSQDKPAMLIPCPELVAYRSRDWNEQSATAARLRLAKLFMVLPNPATETEGH